MDTKSLSDLKLTLKMNNIGMGNEEEKEQRRRLEELLQNVNRQQVLHAAAFQQQQQQPQHHHHHLQIGSPSLSHGFDLNRNPSSLGNDISLARLNAERALAQMNYSTYNNFDCGDPLGQFQMPSSAAAGISSSVASGSALGFGQPTARNLQSSSSILQLPPLPSSVQNNYAAPSNAASSSALYSSSLLGSLGSRGGGRFGQQDHQQLPTDLLMLNSSPTMLNSSPTLLNMSPPTMRSRRFQQDEIRVPLPNPDGSQHQSAKLWIVPQTSKDNNNNSNSSNTHKGPKLTDKEKRNRFPLPNIKAEGVAPGATPPDYTPPKIASLSGFRQKWKLMERQLADKRDAGQISQASMQSMQREIFVRSIQKSDTSHLYRRIHGIKTRSDEFGRLSKRPRYARKEG